MKEYSLVRLNVEKERYTKNGVYKGMTGVATDKYPNSNDWEVIWHGKEEIVDGIRVTADFSLSANEEDLEVIKNNNNLR